MHFRAIGLVLILGFCSFAAAQSTTLLNKLPIHFVENHGLFPDAVAYFVEGADKTVFFARDNVTYRIRGEDRAWTVKLDFVEAAKGVLPRGEDPRAAVFSYFRDRPEAWRTGLSSFGRIVYPELWPGIDGVYRSAVNCIKYEFLVRPGAESRIIMS